MAIKRVAQYFFALIWVLSIQSIIIYKPGKNTPKRLSKDLHKFGWGCDKVENKHMSGLSFDEEANAIIYDYKPMNAFGNAISRYYAARTLAKLAGKSFQIKGNKIKTDNQEDSLLRFLPTHVNATQKHPEELKRFLCVCDQRFFQDIHECQYGYGGLMTDNIRNELQSALHRYVEAHYNDANTTEERKNLLGGIFQKDDWLIYDRCQMLHHPMHGFATLSMFDVLPSTGTHTIYSLTGRPEGLGYLCKELEQIRNEYILGRNPNITIVKLEQMDRSVDFGRLANAPNLLVPSVGSSWALWASLANSGRVVGLKFMRNHNDRSVWPSNIEILWNATVIYNPQIDKRSAKLLGYKNVNANAEWFSGVAVETFYNATTEEGKKHLQKLFDCYRNC